MLKAVFDAKRNAVKALKDISKFTTNFTIDAVGTTNLNMEALLNNTAVQWELMNTGLVNFWNTTLSNLNLALTNAQSNIQVSIINNTLISNIDIREFFYNQYYKSLILLLLFENRHPKKQLQVFITT